MFNLFNRRGKPELPRFSEIDEYAESDKYFYRIKKWFWHTEKAIAVIDLPRFITLDPWPQQIYFDAKGQKTIREYVDFMASKYTGKVPPELAKTVIDQIQKLLLEKIIVLSGDPVALEPELLNPTKLGK